MNGFFLDRLYSQLIQFLIKDLAQIHDDGLVNLLPQMGPENLNQRDLQRRDLAVQEDTR